MKEIKRDKAKKSELPIQSELSNFFILFIPVNLLFQRRNPVYRHATRSGYVVYAERLQHFDKNRDLIAAARSL
jgi:hypothetical protein